jgi:hypothetical protein
MGLLTVARQKYCRRQKDHAGFGPPRWYGQLPETSLANHTEHSIVEKTVGCDESRVSQEMTASREIKR